MRQIHIAISDESLVIREGLQSVFSRYQFIHRISHAPTLDALEKLLQRTTIQIVIINPYVIQSNPSQVLHLKNKNECIKWIGLLYSHFTSGMLAKLDGTIDIFDTGEAIAAKLLKWIESGSTENSLQSKEILTERETDVLKHLADGKSNKEIADKLNISINTVITHRKNISQKTGIKSVSGLTIYAVVQNLISLDNF